MLILTGWVREAVFKEVFMMKAFSLTGSLALTCFLGLNNLTVHFVIRVIR